MTEGLSVYTLVLQSNRNGTLRKEMVRLSAYLPISRKQTTTTCVQMAMCGPCHVFTQYCKLRGTWAFPLCQEM